MGASGEAKRIRLAARLSLAEVGEVVRVRESTIHRWETGKRGPHGEQALIYLALLDALDKAAV